MREIGPRQRLTVKQPARLHHWQVERLAVVGDQTPGIAQALGAGNNRPATSEEDDGSARRYARLLVSEIKLYNEAAVRTGRERRDLLERLRPEIDRARRLYEERVPVSIGHRAVLFQQELVHTLAEGDPDLLGASA